ncbi:hypothetical protein AB4Z17_32300, partial [Paenibacillus sp. TAF43_2]|uniref:hypothetical protein n=1 Tax=Paenibacillus sp. TAF43_2 TaxID=3233069 RepID=UPI003F961CFD
VMLRPQVSGQSKGQTDFTVPFIIDLLISISLHIIAIFTSYYHSIIACSIGSKMQKSDVKIAYFPSFQFIIY